MRRNVFNQYIQTSNFRELFISEMGWNNPSGATMLPEYTIDERIFHIEEIAERSGFQILKCEVNELPTSSVCKKLDTKLRKNAENYICIFEAPPLSGEDGRGPHHLWVAPVKKVEKRDVVLVEYDSVDKASFLFEKMEGLSFSLDESPTIIDVVERVQTAFLINSEKITKDFYTGFKKEHTNFAKFITGIDDHLDDKDNKNKQWYTSVMLNRLMFCYFIQKKGFLDSDVDYLRHKLEWTQQEKGNDQFFKRFYKGFLVNLFHDGLNAPHHDHEFETIYGRIPYLNGGMFDVHQIEQDYAGLDIADDAFQSLFDFFDKWHWHLDDRMTATGRDINPDVLGYIFEQYINDRAQMGAYYTKEDITEYIGRNTIISYLMDAVKQKDEKLFKPNSELWQFLQQSGDRYIYDAVRKGHDKPIPEEIAVGIDTTQPNLLERRKHWNDRTPDELALPTEIWRETIERLQRYRTIKTKIEQGEITAINDFITYNLDIRQFAYDYLAHTPNHLFVGYFYDALQHVTILDPTCGSGAFLFAALNILEPLYDICISRMQEFNEQNQYLFTKQLQEIENKYRSNIQYFIFKSIILRNLYGVDIMVEATEIAKLRLFLKMVAVVDVDKRDPNLGLDPLPDIDFNIRCGNTLVGYATEKELDAGIAYSDFFTAQEFRDKVHDEMDKVARTYDVFKSIQLSQAEDMAAFKRAKNDLKARLNALNDLLNHQMYGSIDSTIDYDSWIRSHQPFHWLAEFYEIINDHGGFDVIIGNPPYVEYKEIKKVYEIKGYESLPCGDLYAFVLERSSNMIKKSQGQLGMIVPISIYGVDGFSTIQSFLDKRFSQLYISSYSNRPSQLFSGAQKRISIVITNNNNSNRTHYTTCYNRWKKEETSLFSARIKYIENKRPYSVFKASLEKIGSTIEHSAFEKIISQRKTIAYFVEEKANAHVYYTRKFSYFLSFLDSIPRIYELKTNKPVLPSELKQLDFREKDCSYSVIAALSSSTFFWFWNVLSDCRNMNRRDLMAFPIPPSFIAEGSSLAKEYLNALKDTSHFMLKSGLKLETFSYAKQKPIIDEIDKILAAHYGFTEEELDFIINYDIKYRMGDELNEE